MKCWCCDYVSDNIGCWAIRVVMVVIEVVVDGKEVYKVEKVVTKRSGQRLKVLKLDLLSILDAEIIQASDAISWVCCASGLALFIHFRQYCQLSIANWGVG